MKTLYTHTQLGDHCICYGIIKELAKEYDIQLYSPSDNQFKFNNVKRLYASIPNVEIIDTHLWDKFDIYIANTNNWFNMVKPWYDNPILSIPEWFQTNLIFDRQWYKQANVSFFKKWDNFYIDRNLKKEQEIYYDVLNLKINEKYIFLHEYPEIDEQNRMIKRKYIDNNIRLIDIKDYADISIFDLTFTIQHAKEIHVINSSFLTFIDLMNIKHDNLNYHKYSRRNPFEQPALRLNWNIIEN